MNPPFESKEKLNNNRLTGKQIILFSSILLIFTVFSIIFVNLFFNSNIHQKSDDMPMGFLIADGESILQTTTLKLTTTTSSTTTSTTIRLIELEKTTTTSTTTSSTTTLPTCMDGVKNQDEIKIDCGGVCTPCELTPRETAICLTKKSAKLYVRDDDVCIRCRQIKSYFGDSYSIIDVLDCEDEKRNYKCEIMLEEVVDRELPKGYPMWKIDDNYYPGYSIKMVKEATNCL